MSERGDYRFGPIAGLVLIILAVIGLFAICVDGDDGDDDLMGRIELVSHDYDGGGYDEDPRCYDGGCSSQDDQWSNRDENRNRGRNRGAFSPGPFDDSPVDAFNGNTICLPGSTCRFDGRRGEDEEQPA